MDFSTTEYDRLLDKINEDHKTPIDEIRDMMAFVVYVSDHLAAFARKRSRNFDCLPLFLDLLEFYAEPGPQASTLLMKETESFYQKMAELRSKIAVIKQ